MLNFVAGLQSDLSPYLATNTLSLATLNPKDNDEVNFQSSLLP